MVEAVLPERGAEWASKVAGYLEGTAFCRRRGWVGERGMVDFWLHYRELCDEAVDRITLPVLRLEIGGGEWGDAERSLCAWSKSHLERSGTPVGCGGSGSFESGQGLDVGGEREEGPGFGGRET